MIMNRPPSDREEEESKKIRDHTRPETNTPAPAETPADTPSADTKQDSVAKWRWELYDAE